MYAADLNFDEAIDYLLAEVSLQDKNGWTASMFAAKSNNVEVLKKLESREGKLIAKNRTTAMMIACTFGSVDAVVYLLNKQSKM